MYIKICLGLLLSLAGLAVFAQGESSIRVNVLDEQQQPLGNATVSLKLRKDSSLIKIQLTDSAGYAIFEDLRAGDYFLQVTHAGFTTHCGAHFYIPKNLELDLPPISLQPAPTALAGVTVTARKPAIEIKAGKTVVNLEAGTVAAGSSALEALEKIPGITVDKEGTIALKGRSGVSVLVDGKPTYLDPSQLATLLQGMSASQISTVELMGQPSSTYEAAGNAGIINIRLKKNNRKGFNGNVSTSLAQGVYPKGSNNLQLNYHSGPVNWFFNYSASLAMNFTRIYALRKYYDGNGSLLSMLEQPSFFTGKAKTQNLRTGLDYTIGSRTTAGLAVSGLLLARKGNTDNPAKWLNPGGSTDSLVQTFSTSHTHWRNGGINFNLRHSFSGAKELSVDVDRIGYRIRGDQYFENNGVFPGSYREIASAELPSRISITSAKGDYSVQLDQWKIETGVKTSHITTDNLAAYTYFDGSAWTEDLGKSNHFLYEENIHALYGNAEGKFTRWNIQGGLRLESTRYNAEQLGNALVKDSSFSRSYQSLFPSSLVSYQLDSSNTFSLSAGRRIDRPAFQKLNPFVFIINKYTYQAGNPFFRPQYTWNVEISHSYKNVLVTGLSYSVTRDYFSQVFPVSGSGIITYTEGNLKRLQTFGASVAVQVSPVKWWSLTAEAIALHRKMEGFIGKWYEERVTQGSFNLSNQLRFRKGWSGELSGFYTSKSRNDIQEVVDPAGQVSAGIVKSAFRDRGTLKLAARDIFYTQWMKGNTQFTQATEYFKLTRDTRVVSLALNYRFGKTYKTNRHSQGASKEEIERVGNG